MNILLTGGTGFIGSHTAVELITRGHKAVLYDNLCNSDAAVVDALEKITGKRPLLVVGDIRDTEKLQAVLIAEKIDVVIHFAGLKAVGESCVKPLEYYDNNVGGTVSLLKAMHAAGVTRIIFSSSSTVYGTPQYLPFNGRTSRRGRHQPLRAHQIYDGVHSPRSVCERSQLEYLPAAVL